MICLWKIRRKFLKIRRKRLISIHTFSIKILSIFKLLSALIRPFGFNFVTSDNTFRITTSLDPTKKTSGVIPTKIEKI